MKRFIWRGAAVGAAVLVTSATLAITSGSPAGALRPIARAELKNTAGETVGEVVFRGRGPHAERVSVTLNAPAIDNAGAYHGFHVHAIGSCNPQPSGTANVPFGSAGGHWSPGGGGHGSHAGDMPSLLVASDGRAYAEFDTQRFEVSALFDGDGSAVIVHKEPDNFANIPSRYSSSEAGAPANGPDASTLATGDAGGRYACGVVEAA